MKKLIVLAIAVCVALGIYLALGRSSNEEPEFTYTAVPIEKGSLKAEITSTGTLRPLVEVLVGTQVSGTIKELYADFESKVEKGQLIALIDPDKFAAKVEQAKADLAAAKANLLRAEVTATDEFRTLRRKEQLIEGKSISQSDYDAAKTKADSAQAQIVVERARVAQAEAKLNEAQLELKYTKIIAPVSGVVTTRAGDVGQTVTASFQTPVLFKIAEDLTRMQVHTNVDEADIGRVRAGQDAVFTVPAFPDETFDGKVTQIRNDPKVEQNVVTYNVILDVNNDDLKLRPGMTANVQILLSEAHDALIVPDQALRFSPPKAVAETFGQLPALKAGERRLWLLVRKNGIKPVTVKTGILAADRAQILSKEIKPGDKVIIETVAQKKEGPKMRPGIRF